MRKYLTLFLFAFIYQPISAQTFVPGGTVSGTWTRAGAPYFIQGNILVADGTQLTIEPGVTVNFQGGYKLQVSGRLIAAGTAADSIRFTTADTTTGWQGIRFDNTPATNDSSAIAYCAIRYVRSYQPGGGIYIRNFSKISIIHSSIAGCMVVQYYGGGIYAEAADVLIDHNKIYGNHAVSGGGIYLWGGNPVVTNNDISYNDDYQPSPGIGEPGQDPDAGGGGISVWNISTSTQIFNNTITHNSCLRGGGLYIDQGGHSIHDNIVNYNRAEQGGGIYSDGDNHLVNNTVSFNTALVEGGGMYARGSFTLNGNRYIGNTASKNGGGIAINGSAGDAAIISNNLVANNSLTAAPDAPYQGGGGLLFVNLGTNCHCFGNVIVNNSATNGGGILCYNAGLTCDNNTIANNSAVKGGALYCYSSSPVLLNGLLRGNTASANGAQIFLQDESSDPGIGYSNVAGGAAAIDANGNFYTGVYQNNTDVDALFTAPSAGSGATFDGAAANWSLQNASTSINAGKPNTIYPSTDYAGNIRVVNGLIDQGAIENQMAIAPTATVSGGGIVCDGVPLPPVVFNFTYGTFPFTLQYSIDGVVQPAVSGITSLEYTIPHAMPGVYRVTAVTDPLSTGIGIDSAVVTVIKPVAAFMVNDSLQCLESNLFVFSSTSTADGSNINSFNWTFGDDSTATAIANPGHRYNAAGNYRVKLVINTQQGCTDSVTQTVSVAALAVNLLQDTIRTYLDSVVLDAGSGFATYQWSTGAVTQNITIRNSGWYRVTVTNALGCAATDSSYIELRKKQTLFIDKMTGLCSATSFALGVRTKNIRNVAGMQGSIRWDPGKITLDSISYNTGIPSGFTATDLNISNSSNGYLTYSWNDNTLNGLTTADSTALFNMWFSKPVESPATVTNVVFSSTPTALEIDTLNTSTHLPVITTETDYQLGSAGFLAGAKDAGVELGNCDSVVYNNTVYYDSTTVYDTLKYAGTGCDSVRRTIHISVYHNVTPTVTLGVAVPDIMSGSPAFFTATVLYGGDQPTIQWYKNGGLIPGVNGLTYSTTDIAADDSIYVVLKSSLPCATDSVVQSNTIIMKVHYLVGGRIKNPIGGPVRQPTVDITGHFSLTLPVEPSGNYSISLPGGALNYVLKPSKTNDVNRTNGVSTLDVALIQNHILNNSLFTSPYQFIAADVNRSNTVTSIDILFIKRLILGIDNNFPGGSLWTFVDTTGLDPASPLPYKDSITINGLFRDSTALNFIGVKLGDVNFDYNAALARPAQPATAPVIFYYNDTRSEKDELIRIPVRVRNFSNILGIQFTLNFNAAALQFAGIENNRLNMQYATNHTGDGNISFLWNDDHNKTATINNDDVLMELLFKRVADFTEEDITVSSAITDAQAWDGNLQPHTVEKTGGKIIAGAPNAPVTTESFTVTPNPTTGTIQLTLHLKEHKKIGISLVDASGKTVFIRNLNGSTGTSTITLNIKDQQPVPAGVYSIHLTGMDAVNRQQLLMVK